MFKTLATQSGFSLERLASLCEITEAGSIGQASRGDPNRQSLLSRQIAELEAVFGVALLARQSRPYRLTPTGLDLAKTARQFFQSVDDLQKRVAGDAQRVVLGAGETLIQWLLFPVAEALKKDVGDIAFAFKNLDSSRLMEALQRGEVDVALIRQEDLTPNLKSAGGWRYPHLAFVPKALSRSTTELAAADLNRLPWALLEGQGHFRQVLEAYARKEAIRINSTLECSSYAQVAMAIQTGRYAGFLPAFAKTAAFAPGTSIIQRPISKALHYERSITLAWNPATLRARPILAQVIQELKIGISGRLK